MKTSALKGLFTDFTLRPTDPSPAQVYDLSYMALIFSIPVTASVNFMVSRNGQIATLLLLVNHFGPIRDIIKSTVALTGEKK